MTRKSKDADAPSASEQVEATQPRPMDPDGFELDAWDLPLVGPRRIAVLAGRPDPAVDPAGWAAASEGKGE